GPAGSPPRWPDRGRPRPAGHRGRGRSPGAAMPPPRPWGRPSRRLPRRRGTAAPGWIPRRRRGPRSSGDPRPPAPPPPPPPRRRRRRRRTRSRTPRCASAPPARSRGRARTASSVRSSLSRLEKRPSVPDGGLGDRFAGELARDRGASLFAFAVGEGGDRPPARRALLGQVGAVGARGDLRHMGDAKALAARGEGFQLPADALRGPPADAG